MTKHSEWTSGLVWPVAELLCEHREIILNDGPDHRKAEAEVFMHDAIAETLDRGPVDLRLQKFFGFRYAFGSFADDFKIADHGINRARVSAELVKAHAAGVSQ